MLNNVRRLLAPPILEDERQARAASLLHTILLMLLALAVLFSIASPIAHRDPVPMLIAGAVLASLFLAGLLLMHQGWVKFTSTLLASLLWVFVTVVTMIAGGVRSPSSINYMMVILIAGLLLGAWGGIVFAGLSVLATLGMFYAESNGFLPPAILPSTLVSGWIVLAANFAVAALLLYLATRAIDDALESAHRSERALAEVNRGLQREIAERARSDRLLRALNAAGLAMERALTPNDIFTAAASAFKEVGLECAILLLDEDRDRLFTRYLSFDSGLLREAERVTGLSQTSFSFSVHSVPVYSTAISARQTVLIDDAEPVMREVLPRPAKGLAGRLIGMLDVPRAIVAPLIAEDDVIGLFSVHSNDLIEDDMPTITAFAHLVAAAWRRAQLFDQARQEIARRRQVQEEMRKSEMEKRTILDSQMEHVIYEDTEMRILWPNQAACESVNLAREELIGRYCYEIWPQRDEPCEDCPVVAAMETGQPQTLEKTTPDGRSWFIRGHPVRDANGEIVGAIEVTRDITERKRAEEALQESKARYRALFDRSLQCIYLHDFRGRFLNANRAALRLLGYEEEEIGTVNFSSLLDEAQLPQALASMEEIMRTGSQENLTVYRLRRKDGDHIWIETDAALVYREGQPYAILGIGRDITERKQVEKELTAYREHLEELVAERTRELSRMIDLMAGREVRMAELKEVIRRLRSQLEEAGLAPVAEDPLLTDGLE